MSYKSIPTVLQNEICTFGIFTQREQIWCSRIYHNGFYGDLVKQRQITYTNDDEKLVITSADASDSTISKQVTIPHNRTYYQVETFKNNVYTNVITFRNL